MAAKERFGASSGQRFFELDMTVAPHALTESVLQPPGTPVGPPSSRKVRAIMSRNECGSR
jgi:hypothetical protein